VSKIVQRLITYVTDRDFKKEVLESDVPVVVCFTEPWNRGLYPVCLILRTIAEEYGDEIKFVCVDAEKYSGIASRYRLTHKPSCVFFRDGKATKVLRCFREEAALRDFIDGVLREVAKDVQRSVSV
jgi:thioredoxin 1